MDREAALAICRKAVGFASTDDALAMLHESRRGSTRYSNNVITQNVADRRAQLNVRVAVGKQRGEVTVNRFDDDSLREAVARAEAIARVTPEDDEHLPPVEPSIYRELPGAVPGTLDTDPALRAEGVRAVIDAMGDDGLTAAGALGTGGSFVAFANSKGAEGYHDSSRAWVHTTVMTETSSGWAEAIARDRAGIDAAAHAAEARQLAEMGQNPRELEPGRYKVVLAPPAVSSLLLFLLWSAEAKASDEKRSALSGKEGEKILSDRVTIRCDLADADCPGMPFALDGTALDDVDYVRNGVLSSLWTSRFWAQKTDRPHVPWPPTTCTMDGGEGSVQDLISNVDRGLYVTRFWYNRWVDPMKLLITGMTRDGLFLIEDGKIVSGVKHLRYNDSPLEVLSNVVDLSRPEPTDMWGLAFKVPAVLAEGFRFTSKTSF